MLDEETKLRYKIRLLIAGWSGQILFERWTIGFYNGLFYHIFPNFHSLQFLIHQKKISVFSSYKLR
jgi:hypothetical protein